MRLFKRYPVSDQKLAIRIYVIRGTLELLESDGVVLKNIGLCGMGLLSEKPLDISGDLYFEIPRKNDNPLFLKGQMVTEDAIEGSSRYGHYYGIKLHFAKSEIFQTWFEFIKEVDQKLYSGMSIELGSFEDRQLQGVSA